MEKTTAQKHYLYHMVPEKMEGTVLHPLNRLKEIHPHLFAAQADKYADRAHIMEQFIPTLEAAWNDVLHFSPIHPEELMAALVEAGMEPREMRFYQIDPEALDPAKTTVYIYATGENKMDAEHFADYKPDELHRYSSLPERTKKYYEEMFAINTKPLLFIGVPHILHKGSVDISQFPIITVGTN